MIMFRDITSANYTNRAHFAGEATAQRVAETCRHGNESRHCRETEGHDVPQDLYSETRERQVYTSHHGARWW